MNWNYSLKIINNVNKKYKKDNKKINICNIMCIHFLRLFFLIYMINAKIIKNIDIPSCKNCVHYKPLFLSDYSSTLSKCNYFGEKNILTDIIKYEFADLCRDDENKCGLKAKYFEEDINIYLKIFLHKSINLLPFSVPFILYTVLIINEMK
jgi:hypothetical protein